VAALLLLRPRQRTTALRVRIGEHPVDLAALVVLG
jgi:hypothetical protein